MSYLHRRDGVPTGKWVGERVIAGKRKRCISASKAEADKWEAYVDLHGHAPLDGTGAPIAPPLGAVAKEARRNREGWKDSHDPSLDQRLELVLTFFGPQSSLECLTKQRLYSFVQFLEARKGRGRGPLSTKTINRYLAVVSALLDYGRDVGHTKHVVNIPWQEEAEGATLFFSKDEEAAVSALLTSDEAKVMSLLVLMGTRAGEFFDLEARQVDTADKRCAWIRLKGEDVKSGKGRSIPLHDFELARWLKAAVEAGTLMDHQRFYRSLKAACAKLGLDPKLNVHSCRHTFGTRTAVKAKPAIVQALMGHGSYKTTQKYVHLVDDDLMAATVAQ